MPESPQPAAPQPDENNRPLPSPLISFIPIVTLIALMTLVVRVFGTDALSGGSQIALLTSAAVTIAISSLVSHMPWRAFIDAMSKTLGGAAESIILLLAIGMLSGAWMISGVVPTLICYGVEIMSPRFFLVCACIICSVVSVLTGSSWTTIATIGVALMGIGKVLGVSSAMTAGAIISGAYFGDKISPLSDTTVLASSTVRVPLFDHIRYMLGTTVPSITLCLILFLVLGFFQGGVSEQEVTSGVQGLRNTFNITPWTLLVPVFTGILIARRVPALVTLFLSALAGGVAALILQPDILRDIAAAAGAPEVWPLFKGMMISFFGSTSVATGDAMLDDLVSTGGMAGMLNTVWLILCAFTFGASMSAGGMLKSITMFLIKGIRSTVGLVSSTVATGLFMNMATSDQYLSIILTANMFSDVYKEKGYEPRLLSRTTEDGVTVTSVLIPWSSCGMTQSAVLGIATLTYLPFCFFNIISPLMSILMAAIGFKIKRNVPQVAEA